MFAHRPQMRKTIDKSKQLICLGEGVLKFFIVIIALCVSLYSFQAIYPIFKTHLKDLSLRLSSYSV